MARAPMVRGSGSARKPVASFWEKGLFQEKRKEGSLWSNCSLFLRLVIDEWTVACCFVEAVSHIGANLSLTFRVTFSTYSSICFF